MDNRNNRNDRNTLIRTALILGSAGTLLAAYIIVGFFLARWLIRVMEGPPYWLAVGTIAGMVLGIINVILLIKRYLGEQNG